jgi:integrase
MPARRGTAGRGGVAGRERRKPLRVGAWTLYWPSPHRDGWTITRRHASGSRDVRTRARWEDVVALYFEWAAEAKAAAPVEMCDARKAYRESLAARGLRDSTVQTADDRLRPLDDLVDHVQDLDRGVVEKRLAQVESVASKRHIRAAIHAAAVYWISRRWLTRDPTEGIKVVGRMPRGKLSLTPLEVRRLLGVLQEDSAPASTAVLLAVLLGLRSGEIRKLRVRDLDLKGDPPTVTVASGWTGGKIDGKTDAAVRTRPLRLAWLVARLSVLVHGQGIGDLVFRSPLVRRAGQGFGPKWLTDCTRRYAGLAKIEEDRVAALCAHGLRGTWKRLAQLSGASDADAARAAGWSSPEVGRRNYAPGSEEEAGASNVQDLYAPRRAGERTRRPKRK